MVMCLWPLKDLNVLVEMLFVTVKTRKMQFKATLCRQEICAPDVRKRHFRVSELLI